MLDGMVVVMCVYVQVLLTVHCWMNRQEQISCCTTKIVAWLDLCHLQKQVQDASY